ncbi:MAG: hypothetical protein K6G22_12955 [Lachnospiraceae bacterium]|nr:hypothetical protein [Lachnospiraceae bacterium]
MEKLQNTLLSIKKSGITSKNELSQSKLLYEELFVYVDEYIKNIAFRSQVNSSRLARQKELGADIDELRIDCLEKIFFSIDTILKLESGAQIPYMYTVVTHMIVDNYRKVKSASENTVSLNRVIDSHSADDDNAAKTQEDVLADNNPTPEEECMAKQVLIPERKKIFKIYRKHCNNMDNLVCRLAKDVFREKPAEIAVLAAYKGSVEGTLASYEADITKLFGIKKSELPAVAPAKKTGLSKLLKEEKPDLHKISGKISNITNRTM